jgi:hypothetical protein
VRSDLPTGTVTFLFTDVEGSTRLLHELSAESYAAALAEHRRVIREACTAEGGVEVDTQGDAFFFAFPTAPGALAAASAFTGSLVSGPISVRVGAGRELSPAERLAFVLHDRLLRVVHDVGVSTGGPRLMIAAGEAVADLEELPALIRTLIETASEILVVSPVLVGRLRWLASDTGRARYQADERLAVVLGHVQELAPGAEARAQVGDDTPLTALDDAIRAFRPDHILVALRGADHAAWQERGLLDSTLATFHVPVTVFEIDRAGRVPTGPGG